jgi:hypothetical protein
LFKALSSYPEYEGSELGLGESTLFFDYPECELHKIHVFEHIVELLVDVPMPTVVGTITQGNLGTHTESEMRASTQSAWYVIDRKKKFGPFTSSRLAALGESGRINSDMLVSKVGVKGWFPVQKIRGLKIKEQLPDIEIEEAKVPEPARRTRRDYIESKTSDSHEELLEAIIDEPSGPNVKHRENLDNTDSLTVGLHLQRAVIAGVALLGIIATFLPWAHVPLVGAIYGTKGDGWITFVCFLVALTCVFIGDKNIPLAGWQKILVPVAGVAAALVGISKPIYFAIKSAELAKDNPFAGAMMANAVQIGLGVYLVIAAGLATVALTFLLSRNLRVKFS